MPYFEKCKHTKPCGAGGWCISCIRAGKNEIPLKQNLTEQQKKERRKAQNRKQYKKRNTVERGKFVIYNTITKKWKRVRMGPRYRWASFELASVYQSRKLAEMACRQSQGIGCVSMKQMETEKKTLANWKKEKS